MNIFSLNWWLSTFVSTLVTCVFIYLLKKLFAKVNVPVVSDIVGSV